jgi:hypothetical protein
MDLKTVKVPHVGWIRLAQNKAQWRVLVEIVINLLVLYKARRAFLS